MGVVLDEDWTVLDDDDDNDEVVTVGGAVDEDTTLLDVEVELGITDIEL